MAKLETILALDTALNNCSVAVYAQGKSMTETLYMMQGHAEHLLPMVERVMKRENIEYENLDAIAVTCGPGAFTGLRIGLSAARAMALALDIPLYGMTTTQILALEEKRKCMVVLETKREDFYVQTFDEKGNALSEAAALPGDAIKTDGFVLVGDGVERLTGKKVAITVPDMALMAEMLTTRPELFREGAEPVYLRGADVTSPKRQNRVFEGTTDLNK